MPCWPHARPANAATSPQVDRKPGASAVSRRGFLRQAGSAAPGLAALSLLSGCASPPGSTTPSGAEADALHPPQAQLPLFSATAPGQLPPGWQPYVLRRDLPRTRYDLVREAGRPVLRARARSSATGLHCALVPTPAQRLAFSWKVARAADQASVAEAELDDAPARLVVAFDGDHSRLPLRDRLLFEKIELFTGQRLPYAMLMYVWGGPDNPVDSVHRNHRTGRIQYVTVESGPARAGRWLTYERDLAADFQRVFGEPAGPVISVGVLTDGDALKLDFEALYGDITLGPSPA